MSLFNLFKLDYWFHQPYIAYGGVKWFWVALFLVLVLAGLVLRMIYNNKKGTLAAQVYRRFSNFGFTYGLLGLLWLWFRQENVPFLAWRFWLLILAVTAVWWLAKLLNYCCRRLPKIKEEQAAQILRNKYLPK